LADDELRSAMSAELAPLEHHFFSSATGEGVDALKDRVWAAIVRANPVRNEPEHLA
jgi:hypothetical protein